jgi:hypothetical protein
MKVDYTKKEKQSNSVGEKIRIGITDTAVISDLLRKHYAHPIRTLVQEYLSNARDAQREVDNKKDKIQVTLPTKISPTLKIRDFGPGLSRERILQVFSQLGSSTKRNSNRQTGGFGIGSKSAFAYRENFFVRSFFKGEETLYEVSTAHSYEGDLEVIYKGKTTKANGVEIEIPVKKGDESEFISAVLRATIFWSEVERPSIVSNPNFYPSFKALAMDTDFTCYDRCKSLKTIFGTDGVVFVIDGIPYNVSVPSSSNYSLASNKYAYVYFFQTGKFKVSISRESIEHDKKITEEINEILKQTKNKIFNHIEKQFKEKKEPLSQLSFFQSYDYDIFPYEKQELAKNFEISKERGITYTVSSGGSSYPHICGRTNVVIFKKENNKLVKLKSKTLSNDNLKILLEKNTQFLINNNNISENKYITYATKLKSEVSSYLVIMHFNNNAIPKQFINAKKTSEITLQIKKTNEFRIKCYNHTCSKTFTLDLKKDIPKKYVFASTTDKKFKKNGNISGFVKKNSEYPLDSNYLRLFLNLNHSLEDKLQYQIILVPVGDIEKLRKNKKNFETINSIVFTEDFKKTIPAVVKKELLNTIVSDKCSDESDFIENLSMFSNNTKVKNLNNLFNDDWGLGQVGLSNMSLLKKIFPAEFTLAEKNITQIKNLKKIAQKEDMMMYFVINSSDINYNLRDCPLAVRNSIKNKLNKYVENIMKKVKI